MNHELRISKACDLTIFKNQAGQVVIILLLVMVVSLAIGLSVVGRSMTEISTATNSENSSRAFSAAEAGIENILYDSSLPGFVNYAGNRSIDNTKLTNDSAAQINWDTKMPPTGTPNGVALEYPPFGKESFAQFWLANPCSNPPTCSNPPARFYTKTNFDLYFGDPTYQYTGNTDPNYPAVEVKVINSDNTSILKVFDASPVNTTRSGFSGCAGRDQTIKTNNSSTASSKFLCKVNVSGYSNSASSYPVMVRVRILFTSLPHPVALQPLSDNLPYQAKIFNSKGMSGNVQRNMKVFQEIFVMPHIFDYAIFSLGELNKSP
ncbi:MAG: pilus assembly PilX N-terminal domain-containing protein [Candidatus Daviesbacteria bacterium]|nr:pilus assembly PilX N-terminal domain-containing protein [Candidatus Daviesbacteria bacterium]